MTATVKAVLHEVFEKRGGVDAMLSWSYEEPTAFYTLYGRMLPQEQHVSGANGAPLGVVILPAVKQ